MILHHRDEYLCKFPGHRQQPCLCILPAKQWHSIVLPIYTVLPYPPVFWYAVQQTQWNGLFIVGGQWVESRPRAKLTSCILSMHELLNHDFGNAAVRLQSEACTLSLNAAERFSKSKTILSLWVNAAFPFWFLTSQYSAQKGALQLLLCCQCQITFLQWQYPSALECYRLSC